MHVHVLGTLSRQNRFQVFETASSTVCTWPQNQAGFAQVHGRKLQRHAQLIKDILRQYIERICKFARPLTILCPVNLCPGNHCPWKSPVQCCQSFSGLLDVQVTGRKIQRHGGLLAGGKLISVPLPGWLGQLCQNIHTLLGPTIFPKPPSHVLINSYEPGEGIMPHADGPCYQPIVAILSLGSAAIFRFFPQSPAANDTDTTSSEPTTRAAPEISTISNKTELSPTALMMQKASETSVLSSPNWTDSEEGRACQHRPRTGHQPEFSVVVPPRSLLVFRGDVYQHYMHGIDAVAEEVLDGSVLNWSICTTSAFSAKQFASSLQTAPVRSAQGPGKPLNDSERRDCTNNHREAVSSCIKCAACGLMTFKRSGTRVSLTLRNAARECKVFSLQRA